MFLMPTIQIWVTNEDMETLRRLITALENEQEEEFGGKAWRMSSPHMRGGRPRGRRYGRERIKRTKINQSYIYRKALNLYWSENEQRVTDFEKGQRYR
jgi:hypothetical protein